MGAVVRRRVLAGLLIGGLCAAGLAGTPARAESYAYDLAGELMSPFCPGRTLASCPSPQAGELIQWIATQEAAGATQAEVQDMLVERFGEEILGAPPAEGITLWAYVFPVAGFLLFGAVAFLVLRRIVAPSKAREPAPVDRPPAGAAVPPVGAGASDEELARLVEAELASRS